MQIKAARPRGVLAVALGLACLVVLLAVWPVVFSSIPLEGEASIPPAAEASSNSRGGRAVSAVETPSKSHDFGVVLQSATEPVHRFPVRNLGDRPVELRVTRVACGCLEVTCPAPLAPGGRGHCEARLTLGGREGLVDVVAQLATSEPGGPTLKLMVRCNIVPDVRLDPPRLEFTDVRSDEIVSAECRVITATAAGLPHRASPVEFSTPCAGVVVERLGRNRPEGLFNRLERTEHLFRIRIDTRQLERRDDRAVLPEAVVFRPPQGEGVVSLTVPVSVTFRHHNHLTGPTTLTLRRDRAQGQTLAFKSLDGVPFVVTRASADSEHVVFETGDGKPSTAQSVRVRLRGSAESLIREKGIVPVGRAIQKCSLTFLADRWPNEPYEVEALLLP